MSTTVLKGSITTADPLSDEQVVDMRNEFYELDPDDSQFTTLLVKLGTRSAVREKINSVFSIINSAICWDPLRARATQAVTMRRDWAISRKDSFRENPQRPYAEHPVRVKRWSDLT